MHMSGSVLPASVAEEVRRLPGVASAAPILYVSSPVVLGNRRAPAYVIGIAPDATLGTPWRIAEGASSPRPGEAIIDRLVAEESGVRVGDTVQILGRELTLVGLAEGTVNLVNSIAFIALEDFASVRGGAPVVSYVLVKAAPGESPTALAERIQASIPNVTALTREAFAREERSLTRDMMTDVITVMNLVGFLIGLSVLALTVYITTFARRAEFGVLKAIGAGNLHLYRVVLVQAVLSVALGLAGALAFTLLLSAIVPLAAPELMLSVSFSSVTKAAGLSLVIAGLAAVLPIRQIAGLDPAVVFRGGTAR
jgi:putative ABC transport system permease protein